MQRKRLARKISKHSSDDESSEESSSSVEVKKQPKKSSGTTRIHTDMFIMDYTPKSCVVMGETLDHSKELSALGCKYTQLRMGMGWLFAKFRKESVETFINTGEVIPYVYSQEDKDRFAQNAATADAEKKTGNTGVDKKLLRKLFKEFRGAFDDDEEYDGTSIIEVIYQLEERFMEKIKEPEPEEKKKSPNTQKKQKRLAKKI